MSVRESVSRKSECERGVEKVSHFNIIFVVQNLKLNHLPAADF